MAEDDDNFRKEADEKGRHWMNARSVAIRERQTGEPKVARRMIKHLADLLRLSLESKDRQEVPLAEEMTFLEHYLAIQKIRFGDHLRIETQIAPEVKYASVPSLFVQSLVENAIRHDSR